MGPMRTIRVASGFNSSVSLATGHWRRVPLVRAAWNSKSSVILIVIYTDNEKGLMYISPMFPSLNILSRAFHLK